MKVLSQCLVNRKKLGNTDYDVMEKYKCLEKLSNDVKVILNDSVLSNGLQRIGYYFKRACEKIGIKHEAKNLLHQKHVLSPFLLRKCDVVISRLFLPYMMVLEKPLVMHLTLPNKKYLFKNKNRKEFLKSIEYKSKKSDRVILNTKESTKRFGKIFPKISDKSKYIPYLLPKVNPISKKRLENKFENYNTAKILFVGADGRRKGIQNFIKALNICIDQNPSVKDSVRVTVVSNTKIESSNFVSHFSSLSHRKVLEMMKQSHIFCLPTLKDVYGLVFVEAMASGCAIVADNSPVRKEVLGDGVAGMFSNPHDPYDIAENLTTLIGSDERAKNLATQARLRFRKQYHWRQVGPQYLNLLREVVSDRD